MSENSPISHKHKLIGNSEKINQIKSIFGKIKNSNLNSTLLLRGESGSGKEVFAHYINSLYSQTRRPFIPVNCSCISKDLFESEFLGHEKGAFTGAHTQKIGYFEVANGGDIFLDEIGDMPISFQPKLLRVLQEKKFKRVGDTKQISSNFRIIAATNKNLENAISDGSFREDLYHRLNVISIDIPPLRERKEDIHLLAKHFLQNYSARAGKEYVPLSSSIINQLAEYDWPGNVRELKNVLEKLMILGLDGTSYDTNFLPKSIVDNYPLDKKRLCLKTAMSDFINSSVAKIAFSNKPNRSAIAIDLLKLQFEKVVIHSTLAQNNHNQRLTALQLGIPHSTLNYRLKRLKHV